MNLIFKYLKDRLVVLVCKFPPLFLGRNILLNAVQSIAFHGRVVSQWENSVTSNDHPQLNFSILCRLIRK